MNKISLILLLKFAALPPSGHKEEEGQEELKFVISFF